MLIDECVVVTHKFCSAVNYTAAIPLDFGVLKSQNKDGVVISASKTSQPRD